MEKLQRLPRKSGEKSKSPIGNGAKNTKVRRKLRWEQAQRRKSKVAEGANERREYYFS
jgi:hypothetical protein